MASLSAAAATSATVLPASAFSTPATTAAAPTTTLVWSRLSPSSSPPPVEFASAVYDSDNHTIVLFGGVTSQGSVSNSTWVWSGTSWTDYSPTQIEEPPARYLASMAFDPALHQLILFGGRNSAGHELSDTWAWNGASWYNISARDAASPTPRDGAALSYDGQGHLLLFGGEGPAPNAGSLLLPSQQSTAQQSTAQQSTAQQGTAQTGTTQPQPSTSGTGSTTPMPPQSALNVLGDTWQWGGGGWSPVANSGPPARVAAASAFDAARGTVVLYGGSSIPNGSSNAAAASPLGDTWTWSGSGWTQQSPSAGPPARSSAVLADDPSAGGLILFGGSSTSGPLADTWLWNGSTWSQPTISGAPAQRLGAVGDFDTSASRLVVFGGSGSSGLLGDTIVLTAGAPISLGAAGGGPTTTGPAPSTNAPVTSAPPSSSSANPGSLGGLQRSRALAPGGSNSGVAKGQLPVVRRGQLVVLHGSGFAPGAQVTITFHSTPVIVGKIAADAQGSFVATVSVPVSAPGGTHHFEASGMTPTGPATMVLAAIEVVVGASSSRPSLATTGVLVGIALLLPLGAWLSLGARERVRRRIP